MIQEQRELTSQNEIIKPGEVHVGIATSIADQIGRLEVVTDRYEDSGYLIGVDRVKTALGAEAVVGQGGFDALMSTLSQSDYTSFLHDGLVLEFQDGRSLFLDKYHWNSIPIVAKNESGYVGSARLIIKNGFGLPTLSDDRIQIYDEWKEIANNAQIEFSQFAVSKDGQPMQASLGLLRASASYTKTVLNAGEWLATTDNKVIRYLNGRYMQFELPKIGDSVDYLGSESTPIWIDIDKALNNASRHESSFFTASFIRGDNGLNGFEWYVGV